ncbi:outer membrane protein (plasmid) [Borreliella afzelii ACA-1]|nr:outer membrane protein [Borreliella afzelii ACA-1]
MRILVGVCIIILALLGCYLPNKQKQAAQAFFDENSPQSSDMGSNEIVTEGIFANLKLYVAEHRLLIDIKETLISSRRLYWWRCSTWNSSIRRNTLYNWIYCRKRSQRATRKDIDSRIYTTGNRGSHNCRILHNLANYSIYTCK